MGESSHVLVQVLNGISLSMILVLISLSLAIIFGLMGIINLAHGEMFMVGAYTVVGRKTSLSSRISGFGLLAAPIVVGALGLLMERSLIKLLYKRPLETLLATWASA